MKDISILRKVYWVKRRQPLADSEKWGCAHVLWDLLRGQSLLRRPFAMRRKCPESCEGDFDVATQDQCHDESAIIRSRRATRLQTAIPPSSVAPPIQRFSSAKPSPRSELPPNQHVSSGDNCNEMLRLSNNRISSFCWNCIWLRHRQIRLGRIRETQLIDRLAMCNHQGD